MGLSVGLLVWWYQCHDQPTLAGLIVGAGWLGGAGLIAGPGCLGGAGGQGQTSGLSACYCWVGAGLIAGAGLS